MEEKKPELRALVREQILDLIGKKDRANNKLPSEKQLAESLQVSRSTIRTVLLELEMEGKLFRRHGSGTYINPYAFETEAATLYPQVYYSDLIRGNGYKPSIELIAMERVNAEQEGADTRLLIDPEDSVIKLSKIYYANERFCLYCEDCIRADLLTETQTLRLGQANSSIFQFLQNYTNIRVAWDMIDLEAVGSSALPELCPWPAAGSENGKAFLLIHTVNYDAKDQPLFYSRSYVDTNLIQYHMVRRNFENPEKEIKH